MYYLVFGLLYIASLLPFRVLYVISDVLAFFLYHIIGYRRQVVLENIAGSFPDLSTREHIKIAKRFYRNFCDNWVETIKLLSISAEGLKRRAQFDVSKVQHLLVPERSIIEVAGHQFNFEVLSIALGMVLPFPQVTVYMPLSSKLMDRLFMYIRARFGTRLVSATNMSAEYTAWRNKPHGLGLAADQSPGHPEGAYWMWFLNRPTAFVRGPERMGRATNTAVVYITFSKPRRGYYTFQMEPLHESPRQSDTGDITRLFVRKLEAVVKNDPALYMWSHKRWKHDWKREYSRHWIDDREMPAG